jgi:hypothetical protein
LEDPSASTHWIGTVGPDEEDEENLFSDKELNLVIPRTNIAYSENTSARPPETRNPDALKPIEKMH